MPTPGTGLALRRIVRPVCDGVLAVAGQPPGIIDFSPYWRPPDYAEGIVIADAAELARGTR